MGIDAFGNLIVAGSFYSTVDFGGGDLTSAGSYDIFVAKFDSDGEHIWSRRFGDDHAQNCYAAAVDASGNVVVAGYFEGAVDFGGGALTGAGGTDVFVARFSPDGSHLWSKRFGDGSDQRAWNTAVDPAGNAIVTGGFAGVIDFGGGTLTSAGGEDIFIAKFGW